MEYPLDIPEKQCNRCKKFFPATHQFFTSDRSKKDGLHTLCKMCKYTPKVVVPVPEGYKRCVKCEEVKPLTSEFFHTARRGKDGFRTDCKECTSKRHAKYNVDHIEERRTYCAEYKATHAEEWRAYQAWWNALYRAEYYIEHKEYYQQYASTHRVERCVNDRNREARIHHNGGKHTAQDIRDQLIRQKHLCYYCETPFEKIIVKGVVKYIYHVDHLVPVSRGGSNDKWNLVLACPTCNLKKRNKLPHEFFEGGRLL